MGAAAAMATTPIQFRARRGPGNVALCSRRRFGVAMPGGVPRNTAAPRRCIGRGIHCGTPPGYA